MSRHRLKDEAARIAQVARVPARQATRLIAGLFARHHEAAVLFLDDQGEVKPEAAAWFDRLARENFIADSTFVSGDREASLINEGRRQLALSILQSVRLDRARLEKLHMQAKETRNDD